MPAKPSEELTPVQRAAAEIRRLNKGKKHLEAEAAGEKALLLHPADMDLLREHVETAILRKSWGKALKRVHLLLALQDTEHERNRSFLKLVAIYLALGQPGEAERRIASALVERPNSLMMRKAMAELRLLRPGGLDDPSPWRALAADPGLATTDDATRVAVVAGCVAGLRLARRPDEALALLERRYRAEDAAWSALFKDGYARVSVFDNGMTRLEFYTKLFDAVTGEIVVPSQLAVTFDTMGQSWKSEPFAFKPLSRQATDFLSVRKRSRFDFHQDFKRQDFLKVANPISAGYADTVALGQSLGGYCALYYGAWLPGCRVLASAPRNPQNPKYSGKKYARYDLFRHEYDMPVNNDATPTIVFDPKNPEDGPYVERSLRHCFPKARLIRYPYCGHSITRYLLDVGLLKSTTLGFCAGVPFPEFDRGLRGRSPEYLRNLAKLNFNAGRKKWAIALATRALEIGNNRERTEVLLSRFDPPPVVVPEPPPPPPPAKRISPIRRLRKWLARKISPPKKSKPPAKRAT